MTTATKSKTTPSAELAKLQQVRDKAHERARAAKRKIEAWDTETEAMRGQFGAHLEAHPEQREGVERRVKPGTEAAKLGAEIRERMREENPHQAAYEAVRDEFHRHDRAVQEFKRERVLDRIAERVPYVNTADDKIRAAFELLREGCEERSAEDEAVRAIVLDTPRCDGQDFTHDPRVHEWQTLATHALGTEIAPPGLTPTGYWKVTNDG